MTNDTLWTRLYHEHDDQTIYRGALDHACEYLADLGARPPFPTPESLTKLALFDEALPARPTAASDVLAALHRVGSPATTAISGGRYFGFVNGGLLPAALAARLLADVWDQNAGLESHVADRSETGSDLPDLAGRPLRLAGPHGDGAAQRDVAGDPLRLAGGA